MVSYTYLRSNVGTSGGDALTTLMVVLRRPRPGEGEVKYSASRLVAVVHSSTTMLRKRTSTSF